MIHVPEVRYNDDIYYFSSPEASWYSRLICEDATLVLDFFIFLFGLRGWRALWYFHVFYLFFLHIFLFFRFGLYRRFNGTEQMILKILKNPWPGKFAESLNPAYTSNIGFSIFRRRYIRKMSAHSTRVKWAEMFWKHLEQF